MFFKRKNELKVKIKEARENFKIKINTMIFYYFIYVFYFLLPKDIIKIKLRAVRFSLFRTFLFKSLTNKKISTFERDTDKFNCKKGDTNHMPCFYILYVSLIWGFFMSNGIFYHLKDLHSCFLMQKSVYSSKKLTKPK